MLLFACAQALRPGGRLLVHDFMASNSVRCVHMISGWSLSRQGFPLLFLFSRTWQIPCILYIWSASFLVCYINAMHICKQLSESIPGKVNDSLDGPALGALWGLLPAGRSKSVQVGMFPA